MPTVYQCVRKEGNTTTISSVYSSPTSGVKMKLEESKYHNSCQTWHWEKQRPQAHCMDPNLPCFIKMHKTGLRISLRTQELFCSQGICASLNFENLEFCQPPYLYIPLILKLNHSYYFCGWIRWEHFFLPLIIAMFLVSSPY